MAVNLKTILTIPKMHFHNPKIIYYDNLLDASEITENWTDIRSFNINNASKEQINVLNKCCGIEIEFPGVRQDRDLIDDLYQEYELFTKSFLLSDKITTYLFACEYASQPKRKLRSFKGFISKKDFSNEKFTEIEYDCGVNESLLAAFIKPEDDNFDKAMEYFYNILTSFAITSAGYDFDALPTINYICQKAMILPGVVILDYLSIITTYCEKDDTIFRVGGNGGIDSVSLQVFTKRKNKDFYMDITNDALNQSR